jgi:tRNA threonylcarbamoyl adenosine modification protein YeaZ
MIILAIDCSANLCAACIYDSASTSERARCVLDIGKGHAEHLIGVVDAALEAARLTLNDLDAIAVSVGPGSFTGIRVAVSAARGFALALGIPAIGVNTLEALAEDARSAAPGQRVLAALTTTGDRVQMAVYDEAGLEDYAPGVVALREAALIAQDNVGVLAGNAAVSIASLIGGVPPLVATQSATADIAAYARVAARCGVGGPRPSPLYLREPDAKPQAGFVLPRRGPR